MAYIGFTFLIVGAILMVISRLQLGKYGTPVVHTGEDHKRVNRSLYKYIRHPMYTGGLLVSFGPFLAFRSLFVLIGIIIINIPILSMRIKIEEDTLIGAFGDEYREYMKNTKRLIPLIY